MPVHNNILWKAPRARGGCRYPAKVKIETEHIDGIWYAGYVIAVRGEGAETRVLVTVAWHRRKKIKMVHAG